MSLIYHVLLIMLTPIDPTRIQPPSTENTTLPPQEISPQSPFTESTIVPGSVSYPKEIPQDHFHTELNESCSRLFVLISELKAKIEGILDPAFPQIGNQEKTIAELVAIAERIEEFTLWNETLLNLLRKTADLIDPNLKRKILEKFGHPNLNKRDNLGDLFKRLKGFSTLN
jgi:hypothetical protein